MRTTRSSSTSAEPKAFRFLRNAGWNVLGQGLILAVNFIVVPYLVRGLGVETYGVYILLNVVAGYVLTLSLGTGSATIKYAAQFQAEGRGRALADVARYSTWIHLFGPLAGAALVFGGARFLAARVFDVPEELVEASVLVLRCAAMGAVLVSLTEVGSSLLQGFQRFGRLNLVMALQNALATLAAAAAVAAGLGLAGVGYSYVLVNAAVCAVALLLGFRLLRGVPRGGDGLPLKTFMLYSLSGWFGVLAWIVIFQADRIFIARSISLTDLTLYAVPAGLLQRLQVLPAIVYAVLLPMLSEVRGDDAPETLRRMYLKSVRFQLWAVMPALALLFVLMPQFLGLWLGPQFGGVSVWPARLLVASQSFFMLNAIANAVTFSRDKPWYMPAVAWTQAAISVAAWIALIPRYGLVGAAAGSLIAQAVPTCVFLAVLHRRILRLPLTEYAARALAAPLAGAAVIVAALFPIHDWATDWGRLALLSLSAGALYLAVTWRLLEEEDRALLRSLL